MPVAEGVCATGLGFVDEASFAKFFQAATGRPLTSIAPIHRPAETTGRQRAGRRSRRYLLTACGVMPRRRAASL